MNKLEKENDEILYVKALTGNIFTIAFNSTDTIEDAKIKIKEQLQIPIDQQRLICAGKRLEDSRIMSDYGIVKGSTLHLVLRLKGAGSGTNFKVEADKPDKTEKKLKKEILDNLMKLSENDFSLEENEPISKLIPTTTILKFSDNALEKFNELVKEVITFANDSKLGEINLDELNLTDIAKHLAIGCLFPKINDKFNLKKENLIVSGTIFCEGNKFEILEKNKEKINLGFPMHVDDSLITMNLCLAGDFDKATIIYKNEENICEYNQKIGYSILHPGNLNHEVLPCNGIRYNMLLFLNYK